MKVTVRVIIVSCPEGYTDASSISIQHIDSREASPRGEAPCERALALAKMLTPGW